MKYFQVWNQNGFVGNHVFKKAWRDKRFAKFVVWMKENVRF